MALVKLVCVSVKPLNGRCDVTICIADDHIKVAKTKRG